MKQTLFTLLIYLLIQSPLAAQVVKPASKPKPTTTKSKPSKKPTSTPTEQSTVPAQPIVPVVQAVYGNIDVAWKGDRTVKLIIDRQEYDMMPNSTKRIDVHANEIIEDFCIKTVEGTLRPLDFLILDKGKGYLEISELGKNLKWVYESEWARKEKLAEEKRIAEQAAAAAMEEEKRILETAKSSAENNFKNEKWDQALYHYKIWGNIEGFSDYITNKMAVCNEEIAWKKYTTNNYVADLESYMSKFKSGKHFEKAIDIYLNYYSEQAIAKARSCDLEGAKADYLQMINAFQNKEKTIKTNEVLCTLYEQCGDLNAKVRNSESQKNALRFYSQVKYSCTNSNGIDSKISSANVLIKRYERPDKIHMSYSSDGFGGKGATFAGLNINEAAFYMSLRIKNILTDVTYDYEVNQAGTPDNTYYVGTNVWTNQKKRVHFDGTMGFTKRIAYPFWGYAGVGVGIFSEAYEMNNSNGNFSNDKLWARNSESAHTRFVMEAGILADFKFISAGFGILRNGIDPVYRVVTIGISFKN